MDVVFTDRTKECSRARKVTERALTHSFIGPFLETISLLTKISQSVVYKRVSETNHGRILPWRMKLPAQLPLCAGDVTFRTILSSL